MKREDVRTKALRQIRIWGLVLFMACCLPLIGCADRGAEQSLEQKQEKEPGVPVDDSQEKKAEGTRHETAESDDDEGSAGNTGQKGQEATDTLEGDIHEVGEGRFTIVKAYIGKSKDGGDIIAVPAGDDFAEDEDLVEVSYEKDTVFEKQTIWDGGARYETTEASMEALEKGRSVAIQGEYDENGVFCASKIRIIEVVLD